MAISLGLSAADKRRYTSLLTTNHTVRIITYLLKLDHTRVADISPSFSDGSVSIDFTADITRSASLTFFDPTSSIAIDSNNPNNGSMYLDRMISIYYQISDPFGQYTFTVPIFCGPITKLDRDYSTIRVECQGKEALAQDPVWKAKTFKRGGNKGSVIRSIMSDIGETKFDMESTKSVLVKDLSISSENTPWQLAKSIANSMGKQLFYDGRGVLRMRSYPTSPQYVFTDENGGAVLTKPEVGYDTSNVFNRISVKGAVPKGRKTPIMYSLNADKSHPLSPWNLGRNGKPRYISQRIDDESITSYADAVEVAQVNLRRGLYESVSVAFDILPVPHLEEHDTFTITTAEFSGTTWISQMTIPLSVKNTGSVGYLKNQKPNTQNIRRRK